MPNRMWAGVDPQEDWKYGWAGIARYRWLATQLVVDFGLGAAVWKKWGVVVFAPVAAALCALFLMVLYLRGRWIRELRIGVAFHAACHYIRDQAAEIERLVAAGEKVLYWAEYEKMHDCLANRIADYFQMATRDPMVNCAIRLARRSDDGTDAYVTKGRSDGMELIRKDLTVPIPADKGMARKLRDEGERGVCHVVDLPDAIKNNWWMECPSDKLPDVKFLMVAPINWYRENGKKAMGGMLFITSRRDNLGPHHVEPIKAFADLLGMVYPAVTGIFTEGS